MVLVTRYQEFVERLTDRIGKMFSFLIYPMMFVLLHEVVLRYAFNRPTIWASELSALFYGVYFLIGGVYALRRRAHINVEIFYARLSERGKAIVDLVTWNLFYFFAFVLFWQGVGFAWNSIATLEVSNTIWGPPIWPVKIFVPFSAALLILLGFSKTIDDVITVITGHARTREKSAEVGGETL
ncbi:MAG TPA: TRAP transporter small permease subunit [Nitrospirota bacterium]|nr:TRAP transporter small permease subunit [Nitrospirota bacterium]